MQLEPGVEIVIMDNASSDNTTEVVTQYLLRHPEVRYFRHQENLGVDRNYDEAVNYARGEYCWLMSDDDLLCPRAINKVLSALEGGEDLVIVNAESRNSDLSVLIEKQLLKHESTVIYGEHDQESFFKKNAKYISLADSTLKCNFCK